MKKHLPVFRTAIIAFILFFLQTDILFAQDITGVPLKDALELKKYMDNFTASTTKLKVTDTTGTNYATELASSKNSGAAILAILNYYSVDPITQLSDIVGKDINYFINSQVRDVIINSNAGLSSFNTAGFTAPDIGNSQSGMFSATSTLDALGTFIAERFKEELTIEYLSKFKETVSDIPEFKSFFPSTLNIITKNDPFMYNSFLSSMQAAVKDDLNHIPEHLINFANTNFDKLPISMQTDKTRYLMALVEMCNSIFSGMPAPTALNNFANSEMLNKATGSDPMYNYLLLASLVSKTLTDNDRNWIKGPDVSTVCGNDITFQLFIGLAMMNEKKNEYATGAKNLFEKIKFNGNSLEKILVANASKIKGLAIYWNQSSMSLITLRDKFKEIKDNMEGDNSEGDIISLVNGLSEVINSIPEIMPSEQIATDFFTSQFPHNDFILITEKISALNDIYVHVKKSEYSMALSNLITLLDDGSKDNAFLNSMSKYGIFLTTLAEADSKDEMYEAIKTAALPVGSFRIKRMAKTNVALNAYAGGFYGWDLQKDTSKTNYFGFTAPVGIAFSTSLGCKKSGSIPDQATQYFSRHSLSLFLSVIDIGAITAFRVTNDSTETLPTITWNNFIAPGAYVIWGIRKSPISIGAGAQYGPQIKKIDDLNTDAFAKWNFRLSCTVDIPLLNFNTKPRTD